MDAQTRKLWMTVRQVLIMLLSALDDYLGVNPAILPKEVRRKYYQLTGDTSPEDDE
jgi:hypothetical protein